MNLREKAYAFVLAANSLPEYCSNCVKSGCVAKLSRCSSCKLAHYCSTECQKRDWPLHKSECKCLKSTGRAGDDCTRLVLRIHSKSRGDVESEDAADNGKRTLKDLMTHDALMESVECQQWLVEFRRFTSQSPRLSGELDDARLRGLYCKVSVNAFGLTNESSQTVGLALHLRLSAIDHSCAPRTRIAYVGDVAVMVPSTSHESAPGREHRIVEAQHSYINDMLCRAERQKLLKTKYNFDCRCEACLDDGREAEMSGYACEQCASCCAAPTQHCPQCGYRMSNEHVELCELTNRMVESARQTLLTPTSSNASVEKQFAIAEKMLELMNGVYYKHNINVFAFLRCAMQCALALRRVDDAAGYGERLLDIQQHYQPSNDLSLLHAKFNLAKLYALQGKRTKTPALLAEVAPVFEAIYGDGSELVKTVRMLMDGVK